MSRCWGKPGNINCREGMDSFLAVQEILVLVEDLQNIAWSEWSDWPVLGSLAASGLSGRTNFCSHALVPLACWSDFVPCSSWSFQLVSCRARWWSSQEIIYLGSRNCSHVRKFIVHSGLHIFNGWRTFMDLLITRAICMLSWRNKVTADKMYYQLIYWCCLWFIS
jgi:hypothetical protein